MITALSLILIAPLVLLIADARRHSRRKRL
ncbi:hypothetical protein GGR23_004006 [Gellertiella hungarica]|uniref:Uncharacterized protein n=1 Tax=Gellertiella hungarica TaxID=1572859 RepID=A0A7W6NMC0_9HYPH|nr:hypothetical protein [Gellertiella hungarica]